MRLACFGLLGNSIHEYGRKWWVCHLLWHQHQQVGVHSQGGGSRGLHRGDDCVLNCCSLDDMGL